MEKKFSDITIEVRDQVFKLNKIILCKIPFFEKYFSDNSNQDKIIKIDFNPQDFKLIIEELYEKSSVTIQRCDDKFLQLIRFLGLGDSIIAFENEIIKAFEVNEMKYKEAIEKERLRPFGDPSKVKSYSIKVQFFEYCIKTPRLKYLVAGKHIENKIKSPIVEFHNLFVKKDEEIFEEKDKEYVKEALNLFYRKEIERIFIEHEKHENLKALIILYDRPMLPYDVLLIMDEKYKDAFNFSFFFLKNCRVITDPFSIKKLNDIVPNFPPPEPTPVNLETYPFDPKDRKKRKFE